MFLLARSRTQRVLGHVLDSFIEAGRGFVIFAPAGKFEFDLPARYHSYARVPAGWCPSRLSRPPRRASIAAAGWPAVIWSEFGVQNPPALHNTQKRQMYIYVQMENNRYVQMENNRLFLRDQGPILVKVRRVYRVASQGGNCRIERTAANERVRFRDVLSLMQEAASTAVRSDWCAYFRFHRTPAPPLSPSKNSTPASSKADWSA